jgi:hypothetical protein
MRAQTSYLIAVICLVLGFSATISLAQQAQDEFPTREISAGANLVVTSISGPVKAILNQTISVTCNVKNQGTEASGAYQVDLYLSTNNTIDPATDRLLKTVTVANGLLPGISKKIITKVVVPNYHVNGLSGNYYYGAVVANSKRASSKQVSIIRFSLTDNNETVTDHKTSLVWQQADEGQTRNWADANQYCADLVLGGKADWRLSSIEELQTIVDYSRHDQAIDSLFDCLSFYYWSSSTHVSYPNAAWFVIFGFGRVDWADKTFTSRVRCVRGGS